MTLRTKIWNNLLDAKKGDIFLVFYISSERNLRKWFKIITILFSASGIFTAFKNLEIPTVISFAVIGTIQLLQSIENFLILSEKDLDEIKKLRLSYYDQSIELEKLWIEFEEDHIDDEKAKKRLFKILDSSKKIEDIDSSLNITRKKRLDKKADVETRNYANKLTQHE
ncbi:hypothetical protein [Chryseobacterium sp.]|uniref:hypothetical protein n=1 Tax=Chryseobacterium sp. TaxID=1871047 RepID=UPI0028A14BB7|nr:hypothetical protein [Chryseobacterium sp.]